MVPRGLLVALHAPSTRANTRMELFIQSKLRLPRVTTIPRNGDQSFTSARMFVHNQPVNLMAAEAFVTVVNLGSLHKAAARLGVSSATISRRLTDLESELGVRLVERTTRSLRV